MTSTSVTTLGGVVVVTQLIPKDESGMQLQAADQARPPIIQNTPPVIHALPPKMDDMTATFLKGEPLSLGVVQIFISLLCIVFSLTAAFSNILMVHAPFCLAVIFMVSGSLAVATARQTSVRMVWTCLVWNLISILLGLGGVAYTCWLLAERPASHRLCESNTAEGFVLTSEQSRKCINNTRLLDVTVYGLLSLLLVLLVLQVCVTTTICVFSSRALQHRSSYGLITVEVDDDSTLLSAAPSTHDSDVALLDSEGDKTSTLPNAP